MSGKEAGTLFHVEIMRGVYIISSSSSGPTSDGKSLAPGEPTGNSYLIIGNERALLFDLAVDDLNMREYAETLAGKPLQLALSHGHYDHIFHLNKFSDVWMHTDDESFLKNGMLMFPPVNPCPEIHPLRDGDTVDLGDRILDVFNIPGHSNGSIVLLDRESRVLFSGDTCARRLLYGITEYVPIDTFCASLRRLLAQDFDVMYSAHDRCALPKAHLEFMIALITDELPYAKDTWDFPGLDTMAQLIRGDIYTLKYFDVSIPQKHLSALL